MRCSKYLDAPRLPRGDDGGVVLDTVIPGEGDVLLEIGPGRGAFALSYAETHPGERVLALEIRRKWSKILDERFSARGLHNARCFAEDASEVLPKVLGDGGISRVAVHFPDPWWKKRHARRLVVQDRFVQEIGRLTQTGALVLVQTDVVGRAEEYRERFMAGPYFDTVTEGEGTPWVAESPFAPARSNREIRAMQDGLPVYRLVFRRR